MDAETEHNVSFGSIVVCFNCEAEHVGVSLHHCGTP